MTPPNNLIALLRKLRKCIVEALTGKIDALLRETHDYFKS